MEASGSGGRSSQARVTTSCSWSDDRNTDTALVVDVLNRVELQQHLICQQAKKRARQHSHKQCRPKNSFRILVETSQTPLQSRTTVPSMHFSTDKCSKHAFRALQTVLDMCWYLTAAVPTCEVDCVGYLRCQTAASSQQLCENQ